MLWILAIVCPPLAAWVAGGFWSFLLNIFFLTLLIFPGWIHALVLVAFYYSNREAENRLVRSIKRAARELNRERGGR